MSLVLFFVVSAVVLMAGYRWVGRGLVRLAGLESAEATPAHARRDGRDYEPAKWSWLLPQHFSAIAAAGPIVGPILAGMWYGWAPAWLWILLGAIFIGGVHDFFTLVASVRHGGQSIAEVVRRHMNVRCHRLFLVFVWVSLVYVIVAFADVTAEAFTQKASSAEGAAPGPAVATSSLLYLTLAVAMGWVMRRWSWGEGQAQAVFLPLVLGAILLGPWCPLNLAAWLPTGVAPQMAWNVGLLGYCWVAALVPLWLLMQPRGALGGYFLYIITVAGVAGAVIGGLRGELAIVAPAWNSQDWLSSAGTMPPLLPGLFITIACGACSGFHAIVASGTTSKQLDRLSDARPVAYGAMLLEAFFACLSLAAIMILMKPAGGPNALYADGIALFLHHASFGWVSVEVARGFALLCFATFIFDTLDACTRLARYVLMELLGWAGTVRAQVATGLTLLGPLVLALMPPTEVGGKLVPLWRVFWGLFGASNQLLAALTLLGLTVWLYRRGRAAWVTLGPAVLMLAVSLWSLGLMVLSYRARLLAGETLVPVQHLEGVVAGLLIVLALWLLIEALVLAVGLRREKAAAVSAAA